MRKTLEGIPFYPGPDQLYDELMKSPGWIYKTRKEHYLRRDRALVAILYLGCLRVSEAIRLKKKQFRDKGDYILVQSILLSKRKPGKIMFRDARLPLKGSRRKFTELIMQYINKLEDEERLFPWSLVIRIYVVKHNGKIVRTKRGDPILSHLMIGTKRAWQIVHALLPKYTQHWLRAFGEDFLYEEWDKDILAVADAVKVDARTLQLYLRKRHEKYPVV